VLIIEASIGLAICSADDTVSMPVLPEVTVSKAAVADEPLHISLTEDGERRDVRGLIPPLIRTLHQRGVTRASDIQPAGAIVVLLDAFNATFPSSQERKAAAEKLIRKIGPESSIAIYLTDPELHIIRDFVSDKGRSQRFTQEAAPDEVKKALKTFDVRLETNRHIAHELHVGDIQNFQLATLESIATHVADLPGKKALIWFCEASGFSIDKLQPSSPLFIPLLSLLRALQTSEMSIYPINCFGHHLRPPWKPPEFGVMDMGRLQPPAPKAKVPKRPYFEQFAEFTGGRFYYGNDQLTTAITEASEDLKNSYFLRWQPDEKNDDDHPLHFIQLTSSQASIRLRYLHSYIDGLSGMSKEDRLNAAERAFETPLQAREIIVNAQINDAQQEAQQKRIVVNFVPEHVRLRKLNGVYSGLLDVIYAFFDSSGQRVNAGERSEVRLSIEENKLKSFLGAEHKIENVLTIPRGAVKIRVVVRDAASGALGSAAISL
jgi:VWFA-related protein